MSHSLQQLDYALGLTSLTTLLLGIFVFHTKKSQVGRVFFFYCMSISWWSFLQILHHTSTDKSLSLIAARLLTAGGSFLIPTLFVPFVGPLQDIQRTKALLIVAYTLSGICAV